MTRILADLPDDDIKWLDRIADEQGKSRAAVLREAVTAYKSQSACADKGSWIARGAGYWKHRADIGDAVEYQRSIREARPRYDEL
ncbi:MAG: ribbon-helix-helix protein, CopG family [Tsuneonella sp.]